MLRFFKSNHPLTVLLLILMAFVLRAVVFLNPTIPPSEFYSPLGRLFMLLVNKIPFNQALVQNLLATFIIIGQALYFNNILNKYKITGDGTFLGAYCYLLLCSQFTDFLYLTPPLIANIFLLMVIDKLFFIYRYEKMSSEIFDLGLIISAGSLFYFPTLAFIAFVLFALAILRPVRINEWFVVLVGVAIPYFLAGVYFFWFDKLWKFRQIIVIHNFNHPELIFVKSYRILFISLVLILITIWAVYVIQANYFKTVVQIRNYFVVLFWLGILGFLTLFLQTSISAEDFIWLNIPVAAAIAYAVPELKKPWIAEIGHLVLFLLIIYFQFSSHF